MPRYRVTAEPGGSSITHELAHAFVGENVVIIAAPPTAGPRRAGRATPAHLPPSVGFVVRASDSAAVHRAADRVRARFRIQPDIEVELVDEDDAVDQRAAAGGRTAQAAERRGQSSWVGGRRTGD
jgi:hypothetical protein